MKIAIMGTNPKIYINKSLLDEDWALKLHDQTLDILAERGGLSHEEIVMNVERLPFKALKDIDKYRALKVVEKLAIKSLSNPC